MWMIMNLEHTECECQWMEVTKHVNDNEFRKHRMWMIMNGGDKACEW